MMNQEKVQNLLIVLLATGIFLVGAGIYYVSQQLKMVEISVKQIRQETSQATIPSAPAKNGAKEMQTQVLMEMETELGMARLKFIHECTGEVVYRDAVRDMDGMYPPAYCKGENVLWVTTDQELPVELIRVASSKPEDAPLLQDIQAFGSPAEYNQVLISFKPNACRVNEDLCGVWLPENYVSHLMNDELKIIKTLKNYPSFGKLVWNPSNTAAVVIDPSCGGVGCEAKPLVGYLLSSDKSERVSMHEAASEAGAKDIKGNKLPYWEKIAWVSSNKFNATIVWEDGDKEVLSFTWPN